MTDKSTIAFDIVYDLYHEAFVEAPGTEDWKKKRKICAAGFFKGRLIDMTQIMRKVTADRIKTWFDKKDEIVVNMTDELSNLFTRIIIIVCFGVDVSEDKVAIE